MNVRTLDSDHPAVREATEAALAAAERADADPARPRYHFRPPGGWMNDPNGPLWHRSRYHLFYQHHPFSDVWGPMHWGHARSRDLVRWEHRPVALAPDADRDEAHCFSGSAWTDGDGRPVLFYTSVPARQGRPCAQVAVRADPELERLTWPAENPVLDPRNHGGPALGDDWRDPYVFGADGRAFLLLGATLRGDGTAVIPLWEATDGSLLRWRYRGLMHRAPPGGDIAFFECPSLLSVGGRHVLLYSAHRPVSWRVGRFDPDDGVFTAMGGDVLDHSPSFYAATAFAREPRGRTVVVGWIRGWPSGRGWNGALGLPRVLTLDGSVLRQEPLPELARLRGAPVSLPEGTTVAPGGAVGIPDVHGPQLEARARLRADGATECGLRLERIGTGEAAVRILWRVEEGVIEVEALAHAFRLEVGEPPTPGTAARHVHRRIPLPDPSRRALDVRLFRDRSVLELFTGGGTVACTEVLAAAGDPLRLTVEAGGGPCTVERLTAWEMESIW